MKQRLNIIDGKQIVAQPEMARSFYAHLPEMLTNDVLETLPPHFASDPDPSDVNNWVSARLAECEMLALQRKNTTQWIGLLFLFVMPANNHSQDIRIGYLLHRDVWGQGLASELVSGLVQKCRDLGDIGSIAGGVEVGNIASSRVLEKAGFTLDKMSSDEETSQFVMLLEQ